MAYKLFFLPAAVLFLTLAACDNNGGGSDTQTLTVQFDETLDNLGGDYVYEGWVLTDAGPVSAGRFSVDGQHNPSQTTFELDADVLGAASAYVLTIEPAENDDPGPSDVHILAGDFSGNAANLSVGHSAALGDDFSGTSGVYILATPTNGMDTNENSGIWFLDISSGEPMVGLDLPELPAGWTYEGWSVIDGTPVTSGTFTAVDEEDDAAPFSGPEPGPPFPGEDYLQNAPAGLTFPTDLSGGMAVISIEPVPDNNPAPFTLKPLAGAIPASAADHTTYEMGQNLGSFPTGTATRN